MKPLQPLQVPLTGRHLIEASAGTGKTYTITTLFLRLLLEHGLRVDQILVLTFTRAATAELANRLRQRLRLALACLEGVDVDDEHLMGICRSLQNPPASRLQVLLALESIDTAPVLTLHSFCHRTLAQFAFSSGGRFSTEFVRENTAQLDQVVEDWWSRTTSALPVGLTHFLVNHHDGLGGLKRLAERALATPDLPLRPAPPASLPDPEPALEALRRFEVAWRRAAFTWSQIDLWTDLKPLLRQGGIDIPGKWFPQLSELLGNHPSGPPARLPEAALRLTPRGITERCSAGRTVPPHAFFDRLGVLEQAWNDSLEVLHPWARALQLRMIEDVRATLARLKERGGALAFADQLVDLQQALSDPDQGPGFASQLAERYPAALIDEFQDTDPVQYDIFRRIYQGRGAWFLIGDPKQAIYAFRNADVFAYLRAATDPAVSGAWTLGTNWRSDPALIRCVNHLFGRHEHPFLVEGIEARNVAPRPGAGAGLLQADGGLVPALQVDLYTAEEHQLHQGRFRGDFANEELAERLAGEILRLLQRDLRVVVEDGDRPLGPGDIAVLTRKRFHAQQLHKALQKRGIPVAMQGSEHVLRTPAASELLRLLHAMASPRDAALLRTALTTRTMGRTTEDLRALEDDPRAWGALAERFHAARGLWERRGVLAALRWLVEVESVPERLSGQQDGARALTDVLHVGELLQQAAVEHRLGPSGLLQWLQDAIDGELRGLDDDDASNLRLEREGDAVRVMTVHASKGLEFPVVFLPDLSRAKASLRPEDARWPRFHDPSLQHRLVMDLGSPDHEQAMHAAERESLAEEVRLLYVALTRARHHCRVVFGRFSGVEQTALSWLLRGASLAPEAPLEALEALDWSDDEVLRQELVEVASALGTDMTVRTVDERYEGRFAVALPTVDALQPPVPPHPVPAAHRVASYSSLLRAGVVEDGELRDHDGIELDPALLAPVEGSPVTLAAFPRGAEPGTALHAVLEHLDFEAPDPEQIVTVLDQHGIDAHRWGDVVVQGLTEVLQAPLDGSGLALAQVPKRARFDELAFLMPVNGPLTASGLGEAFAAYPDGLPAGYPAQVGRLAFDDLQGFLTGYIDLVFSDGERFHVVDYKSNHLGDVHSAYAPARLDRPMVHHHYILQAHLYVVALHRHLRLRLRGYDPTRHLGGIRYLFLRGMSPQHPSGTGVWAHDPPLGRVLALDAALGGSDAR